MIQKHENFVHLQIIPGDIIQSKCFLILSAQPEIMADGLKFIVFVFSLRPFSVSISDLPVKPLVSLGLLI